MTSQLPNLTFTLADYRACLEVALARGYRFAGFHEAVAASVSPTIFVRHDIDYAPRFIGPIAQIEAVLGVRSTYFVLRDCPWYRLEAPENRAVIESAMGLGHWLGLHFDASGITSDAEVLEQVVRGADRLGREFGQQVRVVSFHNPGRRRIDHLELPEPLIHTYAPEFFHEIGYVSDSNQDWRGKNLMRIFTRRDYHRLQLLIHPFWWREEPLTLGDKMQALADELGVPLDALAQPEQLEIISREQTGHLPGESFHQK